VIEVKVREEEMDGLGPRWEQLSVGVPPEPGEPRSGIEEEKGAGEAQRQRRRHPSLLGDPARGAQDHEFWHRSYRPPWRIIDSCKLRKCIAACLLSHSSWR
jgi:hypothetical protein